MTIEIPVPQILNFPRTGCAETGSAIADARRLHMLRAVAAAGTALPRMKPPPRRTGFPANRSVSNGP